MILYLYNLIISFNKMAKINIIEKISSLKERYYKASLNKESLLDLILETEISEQVYNSNAIENSTLTLEETEKILMQIDLDRFINEREMFEAKNLAKVTIYINKKSKEQELNIDTILVLHKMLILNIRDEIAGRFRQNNEYVKVGNHIAPSPDEIFELINKLIIEYKGSSENIINKISKFHLTFENIHPFVDGNGRIGRVLNNYLLIREGYVPINIKFIERDKYYDAFSEFDKNNETKIMEDIVYKALVNSYNKRLAYLEGKKIITLSEYSKISKDSYSNLLNKANRQTIEAFLEKGIWKIGI